MYRKSGQTVPSKRGKDLSPAGCLRRLDSEREKLADALASALKEDNGARVARVEKYLAKTNSAMDYYRGLMAGAGQ